MAAASRLDSCQGLSGGRFLPTGIWVALGKINVFSNVGIERGLCVNKDCSNTTAFSVRIVYFLVTCFFLTFRVGGPGLERVRALAFPSVFIIVIMLHIFTIFSHFPNIPNMSSFSIIFIILISVSSCLYHFTQFHIMLMQIFRHSHYLHHSPSCSSLT